MAEYAQAVVQDRPCFHINMIMDISPNCDCHGENDAAILPNIGMAASFDPIALDQACADLCQQAELSAIPSWETIWLSRTGIVITTIGWIAILMYIGRKLWSTAKKSAWAPASTS